MVWDFKALFESEEKAWDFYKKISKKQKDFNKKYKNKLASLDTAGFIQALKEYELILENEASINTFAYLHFAKDTTKGPLLARFENESKQIQVLLVFFELEFCELENAASLAKADQNYSYYLSLCLKQKKYQLKENEESLLIKLKNTGSAGFARLFDERMSSYKFDFKDQILSEGELLSKLYDEDRSLRKEAAKTFTKRLKKDSQLLSFIFNMIKAEAKTICELRGYKDAQEPMDIYNQVQRSSVNALIATTMQSSKIVSSYYDTKKKLLGYKKLKDFDRYAPIGKASKQSFKAAKNTVLAAFKDFDESFYDIAKKAFDEGWIDAKPALNKQGGAFSHPATKKAHPFILLNYTDTKRDLFTLAHELGHSIHQYLAYDQSYLNQNTALTLAETASIFAEMLVFERLKLDLADKKDELLCLYAAKLEDIFATVYRQVNFTCFELAFHSHDGELSSEAINELWMEESKKMFNNSVILSKGYAYWWSYVPHFIHTPFYCYAYAYAQLLVLALFGLYKSKKCKDFKAIYKELLKAGGAKSPKELVASFGFDINDAKFWQLGIKEIKNMQNEFEKLSQHK